MDLRRIIDWTLLPGAFVEIRQHTCRVWSGHVDAVTDDGNILWVVSPSGQRKLFEKAGFFEVWADEERYGFHYEVTKNQDNLEKVS